MSRGMEWLPYEEWPSKTGIIQLGKEMSEGIYCRGLQSSHKNLMALKGCSAILEGMAMSVILCLRFVLLDFLFHSVSVFLALCLTFGLFVLLFSCCCLV